MRKPREQMIGDVQMRLLRWSTEDGCVGDVAELRKLGERARLSETAVITLIVWLAPFALGLLYAASLLLGWLWSERPRREWESVEDARQAHKEGRL